MTCECGREMHEGETFACACGNRVACQDLKYDYAPGQFSAMRRMQFEDEDDNVIPVVERQETGKECFCGSPATMKVRHGPSIPTCDDPKHQALWRKQMLWETSAKRNIRRRGPTKRYKELEQRSIN